MKIVNTLFDLFTYQEIQMFPVDAIKKKKRQGKKVPKRFPSCNNVDFQCSTNIHLLIRHHFTIIYCVPTKNIQFSEAQSQWKKQTCKQIIAVDVERAIKRGTNKEKTGDEFGNQNWLFQTQKNYTKKIFMTQITTMM